MKLIPVLLSGGAGARLWPVSRQARPKPFLPLPDGRSLLQATLARAYALDPPEALIVTHRDLRTPTVADWELLPPAESGPMRLVLEAPGRNTGPAVLIAARAVAEAHGDDAIVLVLPADHHVTDLPAFLADARAAAALAATGRLVVFGVPPTRPETGFGYLEVGEALPGGFAVGRFVEKPDAATARAFVSRGDHLWNAGMFCFRADEVLAAAEAAAPDLFGPVGVAWAARREDGGAVEVALDRVPDRSFDRAVLERVGAIAGVRATFGWSDVGAWPSLAEIEPADADGNRLSGDVVAVGTRDTTVRASGRLVATVGVEGLVVVDTPDALLVAGRDHAQQVRDVVAELERRGDPRARLGATVDRGWGTYTVLQEGPGYKIKRLEVRPGKRLSLQLHHHRSEHWVVVAGQAHVECDDRSFVLGVHESTFIPAGARHRLANRTADPIVLIEVQCGSYVGEDDIVRLD